MTSHTVGYDNLSLEDVDNLVMGGLNATVRYDVTVTRSPEAITVILAEVPVACDGAEPCD